MITLPLFPLWLVDILGSAAVLLLVFASFRKTRRSKIQDPENALWLFLYWLTLALLVFSLSRVMGHILSYILVFSGYGALWERIRSYSGGLNSITSIIVPSVILFFHNIQRLYRRMEDDHHRLEETSHEILALNREMETLVMERTMSEMALGIAHGIRNPLHIIGGFSHRLLKKTAPDDPARNWAAAIAAEAKHLEQMVVQFETVAQRKEAFFTQENLNTIVVDILEMLQPEIERKGIHLVKSLHPHPIFGRLNKHLLKMALAHVLRNAIEATQPKGEIQVTTALLESLAQVTILDNGRGMPAEVVERVFEPFYTTKIGGTGLGMVFVRQIVDEHRGEISLFSQVGQGTGVVIRLPLRFKEPPSKEEVDKPQPL